MEIPQLQCKNCEDYLKKEFEFCPSCGQKVNDELTIGVLFYNTISNYFSFDARFIKSFFPLMVKPGFLARKYIEGKRLLFLHPAQMYLFISVVFFFIFSISVKDQTEIVNKELKRTLDKNENVSILDSIKLEKADSLDKIEVRKFIKNNKWVYGMDEKAVDSILSQEGVEKNKIDFGFDEEKIDSLIAADAEEKDILIAAGMEKDAGWFKTKLYSQGIKFYKARDGGNILKTFYDTLPIAFFVLLPLFALILKLLYYKRGPYSHHLVFSFYYFSFLFMTFSILFGINMILNIPTWITVLIVLSTFVYLFLALKQFYQKSWIGSFLKAALATFTFMTFVVPTAAGIILFYAFLFY